MNRAVQVLIQPSTKRVPGVKRPVREAGHPPSFSAEVKNQWDYTSTPHMHYGVKSGRLPFSVFWTFCIFFLKTERVLVCETFVINLADRQCPRQQSVRTADLISENTLCLRTWHLSSLCLYDWLVHASVPICVESDWLLYCSGVGQEKRKGNFCCFLLKSDTEPRLVKC